VEPSANRLELSLVAPVNISSSLNRIRPQYAVLQKMCCTKKKTLWVVNWSDPRHVDWNDASFVKNTYIQQCAQRTIYVCRLENLPWLVMEPTLKKIINIGLEFIYIYLCSLFFAMVKSTLTYCKIVQLIFFHLLLLKVQRDLLKYFLCSTFIQSNWPHCLSFFFIGVDQLYSLVLYYSITFGGALKIICSTISCLLHLYRYHFLFVALI
jgi:hypothetical protein